MQAWFVQRRRFVGDVTGSKPASGGLLCIFGDHMFVPISWACKKRTAMSHSTEAEVRSVDTGLRMEAVLA